MEGLAAGAGVRGAAGGGRGRVRHRAPQPIQARPARTSRGGAGSSRRRASFPAVRRRRARRHRNGGTAEPDLPPATRHRGPDPRRQAGAAGESRGAAAFCGNRREPALPRHAARRAGRDVPDCHESWAGVTLEVRQVLVLAVRSRELVVGDAETARALVAVARGTKALEEVRRRYPRAATTWGRLSPASRPSLELEPLPVGTSVNGLGCARDAPLREQALDRLTRMLPGS